MLVAITADLITTVSGYHKDDFHEVRSLDLHLREEQGKIKTIENLYMLPNLVQLNLSYNCISKIEGLECLHQLVELNLAENMISRIEGLENLKLLEKLNLSGNQIQRIPSTISALKRLTHFRIARNSLSVITDALYLKSLSKLINLRMDENPIAKLEHYKVYVVFHVASIEVLDGEEVEVELREKALQRYAHDTISQLEYTLVIKQHVLRKLKVEIQSSPLRASHLVPLSPKDKSTLNAALSLKFQDMQVLEEDMQLIRSQIQDYYKNSAKSGSFVKQFNYEPKVAVDSLPLRRSSSPVLLPSQNAKQEENQSSHDMLLSPISSRPDQVGYTTPVLQAVQLKTIDKERQQYQQSAMKHIENLEQDLRINQQQLEEALRTLQDINAEYSTFQIAHKEIVDDYKKQIDELKIHYENDLKELEETFQYAQSQWDKERATIVEHNQQAIIARDDKINDLTEQVKSLKLELKVKCDEIIEHKEVLNKLVSNLSTSSSSNSGWLSPGPADKTSSFNAGAITPIQPMMSSQHSGKVLESLQHHEYQQQILALKQEIVDYKQKLSQYQSQNDLLSMQHALLVEAQELWLQKEQSLKNDLKANDDALYKRKEEMMQLKFELQQSKFAADELQHEKKSIEHQNQQLLRTIEALEKDMQAVIAAKQLKSPHESMGSVHAKKSPRRSKWSNKTAEDALNKNYFEVVSTDSEKEDENGTFAVSGPGILFPNPTPRKVKATSQQIGASIQTKAEKEQAFLKSKKLLFSPLEKHAAEIVAHVLMEEILQSSSSLRNSGRKKLNADGTDSDVILWNAYTMRDSCLRSAIRLVYFSNNVATEVATSPKDQDQNTTSSEESVETNLFQSPSKKKAATKKISVTPFQLLADRKYLSHLVSELQVGLTTIEDSNALKVEIQQLQKIIGELETKASYVHSSIEEKEKVVKTLESHAQDAKQQALDTLNELNQHHQKLQSIRNDYNKIEQEQSLQRQQYDLLQKQMAELNLQKQAREQEIQLKQESYVSLCQQETQLKQSLLNLQEKITQEEKYYKQQKLRSADELHEIVNQIGQNKLLSQKQEELFLQNKKYSVQYEEELIAKSFQIKQQIQSVSNEKQEIVMQLSALKQEISQLKLTKDRYLQDQESYQSILSSLQDAIQSLKLEEESRKNEIQRLEDGKRKLRDKIDQAQQEFREEKKVLDENKQLLMKEIENYQLMKQENQLQYEQIVSKQQQYIQDQLDLRTSLEQQVKSLSQEQQNLMYKIESFQYEISQLQKKSEELTAHIQSQERQKLHHANQKHLLEKQYSQNQTNLQQLKTEITDNKVTLQQQKTQISLLENEITNKQQAIALIQTNVSQLQSVEQRLSNTIKDYYHQNEELVYQLNQQKHYLQCEELLIKEKQFINTQLRDELSELEKKKEEMLQESKNLSAVCQDARKKLDSLEQQISIQEKAVHQKSMTLQSLEMQKSSMEEEIGELQRNVTKYQNQLHSLQAEISTAKQSAQQIKQQSLMQGSQFSSIQEEYNGLMERLREHQVEQQSLINQQALLLQENKSLEQQKQSLQSQLKTSEKQLQTAIDQLNATENRMLALEQSISILESSKQQLSYNIQQDQLALKKLQDVKDKEEDQLHKLKDEVQELHKNMVSLQFQQQQDLLSYQKQKQQQQHQLLVLTDSQKRISDRVHEPDAGIIPFRTSTNLSSRGGSTVPHKHPYLTNTAIRVDTSLPANRRTSNIIHSLPKSSVRTNVQNEETKYVATNVNDDAHSISSQEDSNSYTTTGSNDVVVFATLQQAVQNLRQQSQAVLSTTTTPMLSSSGAPVTLL